MDTSQLKPVEYCDCVGSFFRLENKIESLSCTTCGLPPLALKPVLEFKDRLSKAGKIGASRMTKEMKSKAAKKAWRTRRNKSS